MREDYSPNGDAWTYFPHDHARSRVYRWGEDGLAGISDDHQRLCFALALWNEQDPYLKERLFGLTGPEGNHGEDVKELYYYLDNTPTHSYMKHLYKYPQTAFPYEELLRINGQRYRTESEYELLDTPAFANNRYFDVFTEYAKATAEDVLVRITIHNRAETAAPIWVLPTLWFRNLWSFGLLDKKPMIIAGKTIDEYHSVFTQHPQLKAYQLFFSPPDQILFTENEDYQVIEEMEDGKDILLSLVPKRRLKRLLKALLNEKEFLSHGGIRSLSKYHEKPFEIEIEGRFFDLRYEPGESTINLFGGNSNWRGPIWVPMNYLIIQSLREYHNYFGDSLQVECPTDSGNIHNLDQIADDISRRLISIFQQDTNNRRPVHGLECKYRTDPYFKDLILFYEYFHGDHLHGLGASHQTGWTGLVAELMEELK